MEQVTAFKAKDGAIFKTEDECMEHEASLIWTDRIGEFTKTKLCPYPGGAQSGMMRKTIIAWERFKVEA